MYYDDEARRFNFVSGLFFGSVLGAGLALLALSQDRVPSRGHRRWKKRATRRVRRLRHGVADSFSDAMYRGRELLQR